MDLSTKNYINTPYFFLQVSRASCLSNYSKLLPTRFPWHKLYSTSLIPGIDHIIVCSLLISFFFNISSLDKAVLHFPFQGAILLMSQISKWPNNTKLFITIHVAVMWIIKTIAWRDPRSFHSAFTAVIRSKESLSAVLCPCRLGAVWYGA